MERHDKGRKRDMNKGCTRDTVIWMRVGVTCPCESTKVSELHWQPRLTKCEAAFKSLVKLSAEEPVARRVITRKFIFGIVLIVLF